MMRLRVASALGLAAGSAVACIGIGHAQTPFELPPRKAGYWEITMVSEPSFGAPQTAIRQCIDAASDRQMMEAGLRMGRENCSRYEMKREGGMVVVEATCAFGPMRSTSRTEITGDYQSSYTVRTVGTVEGGPNLPGMPKGPMRTANTQTAKWVADQCPEGLVPGDIVMNPPGTKVNIKDMMQGSAGGQLQLRRP